MKIVVTSIFLLLFAFFSYKGQLNTATNCLILGCCYVILERLDEIERKIKHNELN